MMEVRHWLWLCCARSSNDSRVFKYRDETSPFLQFLSSSGMTPGWQRARTNSSRDDEDDDDDGINMHSISMGPSDLEQRILFLV